MSQQVINVGSAPNDGTGEAARTALTKVNDNFTELYGRGITDFLASAPSNGDLIQYDASVSPPVWRPVGSASALSFNLNDLGDVDVADSPAPSDGDVLTWDTTLSPPRWRAQTPASGSGAADKTPPQGRLTLTSNTPIMTTDAVAQSSVYYAPHIGNALPIYDGAAWEMKASSQLTMSLDTSNQVAGKVYDLFVFDDAGTIKIGAGPAWTSAATITVTIATPAVVSWTGHGLNEGDPVVFTTTGALPTGITAGTTYYVSRSPGANSFNISTSVANAAAGTLVNTTGSQSGAHTATNGTRVRGSGAGTTELELKDGIWTNKNSITLKNGAGAGTAGIAANTATYVGSIYCTANGQTGMAFQPTAASGGSNNVLGVWNAYNQVPVVARELDSTASWTYNSTTWRGANGNTGNRVTFIQGLALSQVTTRVELMAAMGTGSNFCIGVSLNSTTAAPNSTCQLGFSTAGGNGSQTVVDSFMPSLGVNYSQFMENAPGGSYTAYANQTTPTRTTMRHEVGLMM